MTPVMAIGWTELAILIVVGAITCSAVVALPVVIYLIMKKRKQARTQTSP